MKGISTILAMILIVIITVALIGLTYTFAANLFQTTTSTATTTTTSITTNMQKSIYMNSASASCVPVVDATRLSVLFTLQNSGIQQIGAGEMGATFDAADIGSLTLNSTGTMISNTALQPGKTMAFNATVLRNGKTTRTLTVSAPAGDVSYTFTNCPA